MTLGGGALRRPMKLIGEMLGHWAVSARQSKVLNYSSGQSSSGRYGTLMAANSCYTWAQHLIHHPSRIERKLLLMSEDRVPATEIRHDC